MLKMNVAAAIITKDDRILLAQRKKGSYMADRWEFPGGKIREGEKAEKAMEREIMEELGITVGVEKMFHVNEHVYDVGGKVRKVRLITFLCTILKGEPKCIDCQSIKWVKPQELREYDLVDADKEVAEKIAKVF